MIKVKGFKFSGISSGLKKSGKKDLGLIFSETTCNAHAIFTKNKVLAAPVIIGKELIKKNSIQSKRDSDKYQRSKQSNQLF